MLKQIELNQEQLQSLADRIEEVYVMDFIHVTGLEVVEVLKLDTGFKVHYTYERENNSIAQDMIYCTFGFDGNTNRVVDFEEIS